MISCASTLACSSRNFGKSGKDGSVDATLTALADSKTAAPEIGPSDTTEAQVDTPPPHDTPPSHDATHPEDAPLPHSAEDSRPNDRPEALDSAFDRGYSPDRPDDLALKPDTSRDQNPQWDERSSSDLSRKDANADNIDIDVPVLPILGAQPVACPLGGGECAVGQIETRACGVTRGACHAGTQSRTCSSTCTWDFWSACQGGFVGPSPEVCGDGIDNNCNGSVDEGCACQPVAAGASASFPVAGTISKLSADPTQCLAYGLNTDTPSQLVVFDTAHKQELRRIDLGAKAADFDLSPNGQYLVVALEDQEQITVVDKSNWTLRSITTTKAPEEIEVGNGGMTYYYGVGPEPNFYRIDVGQGNPVDESIVLTTPGRVMEPRYPSLELSADESRLFMSESGSTSCHAFAYSIAGAAATKVSQDRWDGGWGFSLPSQYSYLGPNGHHLYYAGYQLDGTDLGLVLGKAGRVVAEDKAASFAVSGFGVLDAELLTYLNAYLKTVMSAALTAEDTELWTYSSVAGTMTATNVADFLAGKSLGVREANADPVRFYKFSRLILDPKRPRIYGVDVDRRVVVALDRETGTALRSVMVGSHPTDMAVDPTGSVLYVGNRDSLALTKIDLQTFSYAGLFTTVRSNQQLLYLGQNRLATIDAAQDSLPQVFDLTTGTREICDQYVTFHNGAMGATADGGSLFVGEGNGSKPGIVRYDVSAGTVKESARNLWDLPKLSDEVLPDGLFKMVPTPDGKSVYFAGYFLDGSDLRTVRYLQPDPILSVTPNGRWALSATRVYRVADGSPVAALPVSCVVQIVSPDGERLYCASSSGITKIDLRGLDGKPGDPGPGPQTPDAGTAPGDGGTTDAPGTNTVTFASGQAQGAMNGFGSVRFSTVDVIASPTCHGNPITSANPCAVSPVEWSCSDALCVSGLIPPQMTYETDLEKRMNWGLAVCVDTSLVPGGKLGGAWKTMTVDFDGAPYEKLNLILHKVGDPDANDFSSPYYCKWTAPGVPLKPQDFHLSCWDGYNSLPGEDFADIDRVCLQVSPEYAPIVNTPRAIENLCIKRITFGN
jgi:hypothetical protein